VLRGSLMTAVDRPPTAFKKSIADKWVVPWILLYQESMKCNIIHYIPLLENFIFCGRQQNAHPQKSIKGADNMSRLTSPTYFCTSSEPMTRMKHASVRLATARAHKVLPVPGGPNSKTPFGGSIPRFTNLSGYKQHTICSTIHDQP